MFKIFMDGIQISSCSFSIFMSIFILFWFCFGYFVGYELPHRTQELSVGEMIDKRAEEIYIDYAAEQKIIERLEDGK